MPFTGLWRRPDFLRLWFGQSVSQVGSQISAIALPLLAVSLGANALQMGVLSAVRSMPLLALGLVIGVYVDRMPRRPLLIVADLGQAALLASVPVAALFGLLGMDQLYVIALGLGCLSEVFAVAYQSYLPALVPRDALVEGNSKLASTGQLAEIIGPTLGGSLIQAISAAFAIAADAVSFLVSAISLALIRTPEPPHVAIEPSRAVWREIAEGLRVVARDERLRAIAWVSGVYTLFDALIFGLYVLYVTRELGITPATLGLIFGVASLGGLAGAIVAAKLPARIGLGPTLVGGFVLAAIGELFVPLAGGPPLLIAAMLTTGELLVRFGATIFRITGTSVRQAITPDRLRGRVNATTRVIVGGVDPVGKLLGGVIGITIGLHTALVVGAVGFIFGTVWLLLSPIRSLRDTTT